MRVKVSEIDNGFASTWEAGERLHAMIAPALARGEEVVLDFEGVRGYSVPFFATSIEPFIEADLEGRLPKLLRYENIPPHALGAIESVTEFAIRCRDPRLKEAYGRAAEKFAERD
jgi:hypothetical protein